jgi:Holliday junction resolvase
MAPERKLYQDLKKNTPSIQWNRIENFALLGTPDLLGYNDSGRFFTVELKVTRGNSIKLSPHQISFHITHPDNTFIIVKTLGQRSIKLFPGSVVLELVASGYACGLELGASWSAINSLLLEA